MKSQLRTIRQALTTTTGVAIFLGTITVFWIINYYLSDLYVIGIKYITSLPPSIYIPFISFTLINTILIGISMVLSVKRITLLRAGGLIKGGGISMIGSFFALLSGACPACIAGFFPVVMGYIGYSSIALPGLPLYGLEIQIASALLLGVGIYFLSKPIVCKI